MGVIRVQKNSNYVVMNKTALHDPRLSWKAKGLHAYMLSMPDDWKFYDNELEKHAKDGKDALKSAIRELKQYGYMRRERRQNEHGKFEWETIVYEEPYTEKPSMENPLMEKPSMENPQLLNNEELNNELTNDDDKDEAIYEQSVETTERETECSPIAEFEKAFGYLPPHILQQEFEQIIESGQFQEPEAIIVEAIRLARKQMPRNPARYISSILRNFEFMGLFTLEDVKEYNEMFEQKRKQHAPRRRKSPTEINWDEL
ncbi:hypothetical protein GS458_2748 [Geobacillus stearothermophilus]|nr:hypothetical protein GS458_2748 [Geobacillus stearothermophilus]